MIHSLRFLRFSTRFIPALRALAVLTTTLGFVSAVQGQDAARIDFPTDGIMPKREIGALEFLQQHPEYDGRGVIVAIFDTGVDPGAAGLQTTSDGRPKIVDMIDGTGSGDVDTSTIRQAVEGVLTGLTGRDLRLHNDWLQPQRDFYVGMKAAYELYPDGLVPRLKKLRKRDFDKQHQALENAVRQQLLAWDREHPTPDKIQVKQRAELQAQLDELDAAEKAYQDPGPVFDCVVFHDGKVWRAVVDTDADGDLAEEKSLTNYRDEHQWATFGGEAELNFGVNIFDDGKRLSIVADSGAHGTHVAGIVAGNFVDQPELNGVAPGAQLVSVKIGDTRLQAMETAAGLERGIIAAIRNKCDLINMSFGEPTRTPNRGKLPELLASAVDEHGLIFVSSAGNAGPAMSTVGAPGATTSAILGVGAYVSPAMARAEYSLRSPIAEGPFTFTSVGPAFDGDMGVDISAPGGAISPVPTWTLNRSQQMNGTSMASPNACGAIALILSAAKANKVEYSPYSVRKAIQNTARDVPKAEPWAEGPGLIQVPAAYAYLDQHAAEIGEQTFFELRLANGDRGVYLREGHELKHANVHRLSIVPKFREDTPNAEKLAFTMRLRLESTAPWVTSGDALYLTSGGDQVRFEVDPTGLRPGAHYAELQGIDAQHQNRGPLFRLPITVIVPERVAANSNSNSSATLTGTANFEQGTVVRRFIEVPHGATWMDIRVHRIGGDAPRLILLHTLQKLDGQSNRDGEVQAYLSLDADAERLQSIAVEDGRTVEVCLSQYWSNLGATQLDYAVSFHGIEPDDRHVTLIANETPRRITVYAPLGDQTVAPSASLVTHRSTLFPKSADIRPLNTSRDQLPDGRIFHELTAEYSFEQSQAGIVVPRFPLTDDWLYDATIGPHVWQLFDANGQLLHTDDIWPDVGVTPPRIEKGKYRLVVQLRSLDRGSLESARAMPCHLDRSLGKSIQLGVFASQPDADNDGGRFGSVHLLPGEYTSFVVKPPASGELPDGFVPGDQLLGKIHYGTSDPTELGPGQRPGGFPVVVTGVKGEPPAAEMPPEPKESDDDAKISTHQNLADERFDLRVQQLKKLSDEEDELFQTLAAEILVEKPNHLPTLVAKLDRLTSSNRDEHLKEIIQAADDVIAQIDQPALRRQLGTRQVSDKAAKEAHTKAVEQRDTLTSALLQAGLASVDLQKKEALSDLEADDTAQADQSKEAPADEPATRITQVDDVIAALKTWVDLSEGKFAELQRKRDELAGDYGLALQQLRKSAGDMPWKKDLAKQQQSYYRTLKWKHLEDNALDWNLRRYR